MVDSSKCFTLVRGRAMRVTKLDACGAPVLGPRSTVVTEGFISVGFTANTEEGETISQTNAAGKLCILDEPAPTFTGYTIEVTFCGVDPDLYSLMTGQPVVMDDQTPTPQGVGFQVNSDVNLDNQGFSLELWSSVPAGACEGGDASYGYLLVPFLKGGVIGDFTVENAALNFVLSGARSKDGNSWGVGPYDVIRDNTSAPSPLLESLPTKNHLHTQLTTLAPPTDQCGGQELGTLATGATAGTPGTLTPANSYAPDDFAALTATPLTATPSANWTAGQYIVLGDGSYANWDGTAWDAGIHP